MMLVLISVDNSKKKALVRIACFTHWSLLSLFILSDFRRTINELQRYSVGGKIDSGILFNLSEANHKELITVLKEKRFNDMRKWVVQNLDKEPSSLFSGIYNVLYQYLNPQSIPQAVLIIAGYQYKAAFVADQEINTVACLTEIMASCKFK